MKTLDDLLVGLAVLGCALVVLAEIGQPVQPVQALDPITEYINSLDLSGLQP